MSNIQSKITGHAKKQENTTHNERERTETEVRIVDKNIKAVLTTIVHIFGSWLETWEI